MRKQNLISSKSWTPLFAILAFYISISIYDVPHDPAYVIVEGCVSEARCTHIRLKRTLLEDERALEAVAQHLRNYLE